jgi:hypothetical protein
MNMTLDLRASSHLKLAQNCVRFLQVEYEHVFGGQYLDYFQVIAEVCETVFQAIAACDLPYHNLDHTIQVALVGQEILKGKQLCHHDVTPSDWLDFMVSLICHDIGYVKGICQQDQVSQNCYVTGSEGNLLELAPETTGASLTPYHVDRGQVFVAESLDHYPLLNIEKVQENIEMTRFPVPKNEDYQDTFNFPGLTRGADLIGQLGDPSYLSKLPALFQEFEEIGSNKILGYANPKELEAGYPSFYWNVISLFLTHSIRYLELTRAGQAILTNLYGNRARVEQALAKLKHGEPGIWQHLKLDFSCRLMP